MFRKINYLVIAMILITLSTSTAAPLQALTRPYRGESNDIATSKVIQGILETKITDATPIVSADLNVYAIYDAFILALEIMQESPIIEEVEYPMMAPDQSMIFIPYFPREQPETLRFIALYRRMRPRSIAVYNISEARFSEFTSKHYSMHFHYVETPKAETNKAAK